MTVVKVAIIDTGIDLDHPDLHVNAKGRVNYGNRKMPDDDHRHGTHVAAIVGAIENDIGVVGVTEGVQLFAVKVLDRRGSGYMGDLALGIRWAKNKQMHIANMSQGGSLGGKPLKDAVAYASNMVLLVAASDNRGNGMIDSIPDEISYPAVYAGCQAVGSTARRDQVSGFSNTGDQLDMAAPGYAILSTYRGGTYRTLSGTSMASPHVAGLAALLISGGQTYTGTNLDGEIANSALWSQMQVLGDTGTNYDPWSWAFGKGTASFTAD